jgi:glycosyltransferase involved in cell wall biosynthesis
LGESLNRAIRLAMGEYCVRFDDDDWQATDRVSKQLALSRLTDKPVVACSNGLYWSEGSEFVYEHTGDAWMCSGFSHFFRRDYAINNPMPDISVGEDTRFIRQAYENRALCSVSGAEWLVARNHAENTGSTRDFSNPQVREFLLSSDNWREYPFSKVAHIVEPIIAATAATA